MRDRICRSHDFGFDFVFESSFRIPNPEHTLRLDCVTFVRSACWHMRSGAYPHCECVRDQRTAARGHRCAQSVWREQVCARIALGGAVRIPSRPFHRSARYSSLCPHPTWAPHTHIAFLNHKRCPHNKQPSLASKVSPHAAQTHRSHTNCPIISGASAERRTWQGVAGDAT